MQPGHRPTVLLIDDDPDILKLMECVFENEEIDIITRRIPEQGLQYLSKHPVDCVLLDIHFAHAPESLAFLAALRALPEKRKVPVLATSAMVNREVRTQVLEMGAERFIAKPFYPAEIIREVRLAVYQATAA